MARKNSIQRLREHFNTSKNYPLGAFILPDGGVIPAYGTHEAMAQRIHTTIKNLIQAGVVRYHVYDGNRFGTSMGVEGPEKVTFEQHRAIVRIVMHCKPVILSICLGKRAVEFGDVFKATRGIPRTRVATFLRGGR